ncbi:MAG: NaeI family type II restriction endonuclease, partial [Polaromonas sp.]|nr:NaeI family type II restriction endonuclease [Polaromonas sp.]
VAQQDDFMKRVRENGGARTALRPEGIIILGQFGSHAVIANDLGVPTPGPGESVAVRIVPSAQGVSGAALIENQYWRKAQSDDPAVSAPKLPSS